MASTLCQNGLKTPVFCFCFCFVCFVLFCSVLFCFVFVKKLKISGSLDHMILFIFTRIWYKHFSKNVWRDLRLQMSALPTAVGKRIDSKFTIRIDFFDRVFYIIIADADIGSLKSLHTLFDKYLEHMLVEFE